MTRMTRPECLARLTSARVGRVAVTAKAMPAIIPVNYTFASDSIVFRTKSDGLLARACDGSVVAFEVDRLADEGDRGWSVMVIGVATILTGAAADQAAALDLVSAMGEDRDVYVAVSLGRVSGREVGEPVPVGLRSYGAAEDLGDELLRGTA